MYHGILNIYKEKGFTSHDVVAKLRGITKQKKIGHTGTLDPDAEGVLPVCMGNGTKLCQFLTDKDKVYRAVLLLGVTTDTQDAGGKILSSLPVNVDETQVKNVMEGFIGTYGQVPPMYSAVKKNGKRLYELARAGVTVEREPRMVSIYQIRILEMDLPRVTFEVHCGKGTYIRTLCEDIGNQLGCGGCMESLLRVKSGSLSVCDSVTLAQAARLHENGELDELILPTDSFFSDYPALHMKPTGDCAVHNGNPFIFELTNENKVYTQEVRVYDSDGVFIGIYRYAQEKGKYVPVKMFPG